MCAKSKSFFGLRRGSTKSLTFQVLDGQQITKDRVTEVRNPRTEKQRIQRVIMNTALRAYSAMKEICDHSFEGVAYGGKTQQAFLAENIRTARMRLADKGDSFAAEKAFTPLGKTFVAPNAYVISKGSLPSAEYTLGDGLTIVGGQSYADLLAHLHANAGDQMTICMLVGDAKPQNTHFVYGRVILMPQDESGNNLTLASALVADGAIANPNLRNENTDVFAFEVAGGNLTITYPGEKIHAAAIIMSRLVNGSWLRSSQSMVFASPKVGYTLGEAIASSSSEINVADPYYLNNAGTAAVTPVAGVTSVLYNDVALASGATVGAGHNLVINGQRLGDANIELYNGSQKYVQASATSSKITYNLSAVGNYRLLINGEEFANFKIVDPADLPPFTAMKFGGVAYATGANVTVGMNTTSQLQLTTGETFDSNKVVASNANIVISNKSLSGNNFTANVQVKGDGTITYNGSVVIAIKAEEDDDFVTPLG